MKLISFSDRSGTDGNGDTVLERQAKQLGWESRILVSPEGWPCNAHKFHLLHQFLQSEADNGLYLMADLFDVALYGSPAQVEDRFHSIPGDIIFSAEANFYFRESDLQYFYWKYYPRGETPYDFLNSGLFIGRAPDLLAMTRGIMDHYGFDHDDPDAIRKIRSDQYLYSRFFVDVATGAIPFPKTLTLDRSHRLFGVTGGRMRVEPVTPKGKIHDFLGFQYERKLLKTCGVEEFQDISMDYVLSGGSPENSVTGQRPLALHIPASRSRFPAILERMESGQHPRRSSASWLAVAASRVASTQTAVACRVIRYKNGENRPQSELFRYCENGAGRMSESMEEILDWLSSEKPFALAHFNEGEIRFIRDYLEGRKKPYNRGRRQNTYRYELGKSLHAAFLQKTPEYYTGIPCNTCYPELAEFALDLHPDVSRVRPAMVFHHNLSQIPRLLACLSRRKLAWVMNDGQDPRVLVKLGLCLSKAEIIRVPFKNAYTCYDQLKNHRFEPGTVVVFTVGMLGKILAHHWFVSNPGITVITPGAALDDLIQLKYMRFRLFPKDTPFTRNLYRSRSFLFGYKSPCPVCYQLQLKQGDE